ncbi:MAG: hypothetical protein IH614_06795 [Desulfuromonadales bacterium]|nr:hypothetical protein [Desulfuromonadales bacterium]
MLPAAISLFCAFAGTWLWLHDRSVTAENHLLENSQAVFLALAIALHIVQSARTGDGAVRLFHLTLGLLCLSVLVREIDIDKLGSAAIWNSMEVVVRLCVVLVWIVLGSYLLRHWEELWRRRLPLLISMNSFLVYLGIFFYMASWFFDKSVIPVNPDVSQLWEELLQLSATVFFFVSALRPLSREARGEDRKCATAIAGHCL